MARETLLTEEVHKRIVAALEAGATIADASAYGGVDQRTYYDWTKRGREYETHICDGGHVVEGEDRYRLFYLDTRGARSKARIRAVGIVSRAAEHDWKAAAWFLERSDPDSWGRVTRTELSGPQGGPVEVADVGERERRLAASLAAALAASPPKAVESADVEDAEVIPDDGR